MSSNQAFIAIAPSTGYVIQNSAVGDLLVYTQTSNQAISFGRSNAPPTLKVTSSNIAFGTSNVTISGVPIRQAILAQFTAVQPSDLGAYGNDTWWVMSFTSAISTNSAALEASANSSFASRTSNYAKAIAPGWYRFDMSFSYGNSGSGYGVMLSYSVNATSDTPPTGPVYMYCTPGYTVSTYFVVYLNANDIARFHFRVSQGNGTATVGSNGRVNVTYLGY